MEIFYILNEWWLNAYIFFPNVCHCLHKKTPSCNNTRENCTHGHHQMVDTEIRLIIFFAAKDGEALYSQQKQDQDRKSTRLNSSHHSISYAVFCLKKKK